MDGEYTARAFVTSFEELGIDLHAEEENYASIEGDTTRYLFAAEAIAAAQAGDTIRIHGTVKWGYDAESWPDGGLTVAGVGENASLVLNGAYASESGESRKNYLGCDMTFNNLTMELKNDMNYIFACGHRLEIGEDVVIKGNGTIDSGSIGSAHLTVVGGSDMEEVDHTELILHAGTYDYIIGGGLTQDVAGNTDIYVGSEAKGSPVIIGGGYRGNVCLLYTSCV